MTVVASPTARVRSPIDPIGATRAPTAAGFRERDGAVSGEGYLVAASESMSGLISPLACISRMMSHPPTNFPPM